MSLNAAPAGVLSELSDEVLAARAPFDFEAFAELYRRYLCPVYRLVRAQVGDDATAEDLTAQVFFKALTSVATFRADGSYKAWLFRIAHNCVSSHRKAKSKRAIVVDQVPDGRDPQPSPASVAIAGEQRSVILGQVDRLPPSQREVVALRYLEDMTIEEIAESTRRTRGAVRILLHRARSRLRKALEGKELT
jgi:RNA polymerase sigma-70 factor, ECF subfamily